MPDPHKNRQTNYQKYTNASGPWSKGRKPHKSGSQDLTRDIAFFKFYLEKIQERFLKNFWITMLMISLYLTWTYFIEFMVASKRHFIEDLGNPNGFASNFSDSSQALPDNSIYANLTSLELLPDIQPVESQERAPLYRFPKLQLAISNHVKAYTINLILAIINTIFLLFLTIKADYDYKNTSITRSGNYGNIIFSHFYKRFPHETSTQNHLNKIKFERDKELKINKTLAKKHQKRSFNQFAYHNDNNWRLKLQYLVNTKFKYVPYFYLFGFNLVMQFLTIPFGLRTIIFCWTTFAMYNSFINVRIAHLLQSFKDGNLFHVILYLECHDAPPKHRIICHTFL